MKRLGTDFFNGLLATGARLAACFILAISPASAIVLIHAVRTAGVFARRGRVYNSLVAIVSSLEERLRGAEASLNALLQERQNRNAFEIEHCYGFEGRTFIAMRKKRGPGLPIGADVAVIERDAGTMMGVFRLIKESDGLYVCELAGYMDALWLGNIKQHGSQRSEAPPEAIAWVLTGITGETNDR